MPGVLSKTQIDSFKEDGVLILPGFVDEAQLQRWREQVWAGLDASPDDPSTWPKKGGHANVKPPVPFTPTPNELPQFKALIDQLGGGQDSLLHFLKFFSFELRFHWMTGFGQRFFYIKMWNFSLVSALRMNKPLK